MNWTFDTGMITDDEIHAIAMGKLEVSIKHPGAEHLLPRAERLVTAGHVMLVENTAWVFDPDKGEWRQVYDTRCGHLCPDDPCIHQLAAWLARHIARFEQGPPPADYGPVSAAPAGTLGGLGPGLSGGRRSGSSSSGRRRKTCQDCSRCGFYRHGSCNNPNKKAGRGRR